MGVFFSEWTQERAIALEVGTLMLATLPLSPSVIEGWPFVSIEMKRLGC